MVIGINNLTLRLHKSVDWTREHWTPEDFQRDGYCLYDSLKQTAPWLGLVTTLLSRKISASLPC